MTSILRKIFRRAERAFTDDGVVRELEQEAIFVSEPQELDREDLLAALESEEEDESPSVLVTVYTGDTPTEDRGWFEDAVADYVESEGIGTWLGGGQGSIAENHFFDVSFAVIDVAEATPKIRSFVNARFPGVRVEITTSLDR